MESNTFGAEVPHPDHPVMRRDYAVFAPPMEAMITTIGDWIDQQVTGGYIYGPSRYGKSRTVKWFLRSELAARFGRELPIVVWIREDTLIREGEFWNMLLRAAKFEFLDPTKPKTKPVGRYLFRERLETMARAARTHCVVLLIDEAQLMTLNEWLWLLGLQDLLDDDGFRLITISVGTHQLGFVPDYLSRTGNAHITARFFAQDAPFRGLRSADELAYVLRGYDLDSEWPSGSGLSFLQYFAPDDFAHGRRLADCAPRLWASFEALLPPGLFADKARATLELPMQHVTHTVEALLRALGRGEEWEAVTSPARLLTAVAKTGFTDFMRYISHDLDRR